MGTPSHLSGSYDFGVFGVFGLVPWGRVARSHHRSGTKLLCTNSKTQKSPKTLKTQKNTKTMYVRMCVYVYVRMCACVYVCMHVRVYVCVYVCVYVREVLDWLGMCMFLAASRVLI